MLVAWAPVAAAATGAASAVPAAAAPGQLTWGIRPSAPGGPDGRPYFTYKVDAGVTLTDWVAVTNYSARQATFRVYAADAMTVRATGGFTLIGSTRASRDLGSWTSVDGRASSCAAGLAGKALASCVAALGTTVTLAPGRQALIPFAIRVPSNATPGDHSAGIVASVVTVQSGASGASVRREDRVGARVYVRVNGALRPAAGVAGMVGDYQGGWNPLAGGRATVGFDVTNTGNERVTVVPSVRLTGVFGVLLGSRTLALVKDLLPGGTVHVTVVFDGVPPVLVWWGDVRAAIRPPAAGLASAGMVGWAVPWGVLAILVAFGMVVAGGLWWRRRRRLLLARELAAYTQAVVAADRQTRGTAPAARAQGSAGLAPAGVPLAMGAAPPAAASREPVAGGPPPPGSGAGGWLSSGSLSSAAGVVPAAGSSPVGDDGRGESHV